MGMLARYTMYRGQRPTHDPLPAGIRHDTRKHTNHCLRPPADAVRDYLQDPSPAAWGQFQARYQEDLERRFKENQEAFAALAALAQSQDVFLGCSCPTKKNPQVLRCHTVLALHFMKAKFPDLDVRFPQAS